jgi:hypothetical protein
VTTEELRQDMMELNQLLKLVKRRSIKEVILSEINLVSAKKDTLKTLTEASTDSVMSWTDVVTKTKRKSNTRQNKTYLHLHLY